MRKRNVKILSIIFLGSLLAAAAWACAPSTDPGDRLAAHYEEIIRLLKDPNPDIKAKKTLIENYWKSHQGELDLLRKALEDDLAKVVDDREKEMFVTRFEKLLFRLREMQNRLKENGIEL